MTSSAISGLGGAISTRTPVRVLDERRLERVEVAPGHLARHVGDRLVLGVEVEQHADVAELEAAVDERDAHVELGPRPRRRS